MIQQSHSWGISRKKHASKGHRHASVHCSIADNSQYMEITYMFINRGIGREDVAHIYKGILLIHKKNK